MRLRSISNSTNFALNTDNAQQNRRFRRFCLLTCYGNSRSERRVSDEADVIRRMTAANVVRRRGGSPLFDFRKKLFDFVEGFLDGVHGIGVGYADEILAAVAEGSAGDYRHVLGVEERERESLAVHAR